MSCCPPRGAEPFTESAARRDARRYRRRGLGRGARRLVAAVDPAGAEVLEVGGGVGALQLELLRAGAERATNVELSPAYERPARELLREAGLEERVERRVLDFARDAAVVPAADLVVLHRVVCCSPDVDGLVGSAARHARRSLALSFPRDAWWLRLGCRAVNVGARLAGWEWRFYVHRREAIVRAAERNGLRLARDSPGLVWAIAVLERQ